MLKYPLHLLHLGKKFDLVAKQPLHKLHTKPNTVYITTMIKIMTGSYVWISLFLLKINWRHKEHTQWLTSPGKFGFVLNCSSSPILLTKKRQLNCSSCLQPCIQQVMTRVVVWKATVQCGDIEVVGWPK